MKIFNIRVCPICVAVAITWISMLVLRFLGYPISIPALALLIGGSVVGIAYQLEERLPDRRFALVFKMLFIPVGFIAGYAVVEEKWLLAGIVSGALALVAGYILFASPRGADLEMRNELEKKLDDCC